MRYKTASLGTKATFVAADESIYYDKDGSQIGFVAYSPYSSSLSGESYASENLQGATITISGVAPTGTYNIISDELSVGAQSDKEITCRTISSGESYEAILIPDSGIELSAQIIIGDSCIGGIIGGSFLTSSFDVIDCHNSGTITADNYQAGGIAGDTYGGVSCCSNSGKITSSNSGTGGIVGCLYEYNVSVNSSYNTGEVVGVYSVGGIVGASSHSTYNCYNRGNVSGYNCVGGITGYWYYNFYGDHILANSYNTGVINGLVSTGEILGLEGREDFLDIYCAYYFDTIESAQTYGEPMSEDYMKTSAFVDLINDGQTVWVIDDADNPINDGFPILDWQLTQR